MDLVKRIANSGRQLGKVPVTLAVSIAAATVAMFPQLGELLQFDRARIAGGEIWRLATCHLTHWSAEHLQWDLLMFMVLGAVCELRHPRRMRLCLAAGAAAVSATVFLLFPGVSQYRGLSGIDTALFTMLALELFCEARRDHNQMLSLATGAMLLGFFAKAAYEAIAGATIFVDQQSAGFVPLVWDHIAGATIGTLLAVFSQTSSHPMDLTSSHGASSATFGYNMQ